MSTESNHGYSVQYATDNSTNTMLQLTGQLRENLEFLRWATTDPSTGLDPIHDTVTEMESVAAMLERYTVRLSTDTTDDQRELTFQTVFKTVGKLYHRMNDLKDFAAHLHEPPRAIVKVDDILQQIYKVRRDISQRLQPYRWQPDAYKPQELRVVNNNKPY